MSDNYYGKHDGSRKQNCKTREPHTATNISPTHPQIDRTIKAHAPQPTHPRRATAIQQSHFVRSAQSSREQAQGPWVGFKIYTRYRLFGRRDAPRSPRWSSAPVLSLPRERAVVWGGRGPTARPREDEWSSGVAAVSWVYYNQNIFKDLFGHHVHYPGASYTQDLSSDNV